MCFVTVVILAEDRCIQEKLQYYDLKVQTMAQVAPIQLYAASVLSSLLAHLGECCMFYTHTQKAVMICFDIEFVTCTIESE